MQLRPEDRSRGQVIIVAALVIAAIFVGLALVLNSGIYAENLSSRETTDTDGALSFTLATDETIAEAYERTNAANESTASGAETTFNNTMDSWESAQQRRGAMQGIGIDVEHTAHVGWRLEQGTSANLTSDDNVSKWQLVDNTKNIAEFQLNISRDDLHDADTDWSNTGDKAFNVTLENASGTEWNLFIFRDSGNSSVVVHAGNPDDYSNLGDLLEDEDRTCSESTTYAAIDFKHEKLNESSCEPLNFSNNVNDALDLSYGNGDQARGTYILAANGSNAAVESNFNGPTDDDDPTAQAIVYSVSYASHYEKADMTYERRGTHAVREETYAS